MGGPQAAEVVALARQLSRDAVQIPLEDLGGRQSPAATQGLASRGQQRQQGESSSSSSSVAGSSSTASSSSSTAEDGAVADAHTVGTGVMVGVNAAAMGTSYLYEYQSRAAPYSALAMTLFGVMTVVFLSVTPLTDWLLGSLGV
jgi:cobalamin biosynthesis Mg chelatase CobN